MGLDDLLAKLEREAATPDTLKKTSGYQGKALPLLGCTPDTPDTPQISNDGAKAEPIEPGRSGYAVTDDERRFCSQCGNLRDGVCIVAKPGGLVSAIVGYRPALVDTLRRCAGYSPNASDTDQRPGGERWPGMIPKGTQRADY
jgi:hypothetical protein